MVSSWIATQVLTTLGLAERVGTIEYFIRVAQVLSPFVLVLCVSM